MLEIEKRLFFNLLRLMVKEKIVRWDELLIRLSGVVSLPSLLKYIYDDRLPKVRKYVLILNKVKEVFPFEFQTAIDKYLKENDYTSIQEALLDEYQKEYGILDLSKNNFNIKTNLVLE